MKQLLKQFFVYGLGATISKFLSVFLLPIYSSVFTPEDYGNLDLLTTLSTIISVFGLLQIETGLQRYYYDYDGEKQQKLVSSAFSFTFICTLFFLLISSAFIPFISNSFLNGCYKFELFVSLLAMIPMNLVTIIFVDFRFKNKSLLYTILTVFMVMTTAISAIIAVKVFNCGIMGVIGANTATYFIVFIASFLLWKKDSKLSIGDKQMIKEMLSFGLPQFPARLGSMSNSYINRFFMLGMLSIHAIGIYAISLKIASVMQMFLMAFQLSWIPYLYNLLKQPDHKKNLIDIYKHVTLLVAFIVVLITMFSKEIVLLLTNDQYIEAAKYAPILSYFYGLYLLKEIVDIGVKVKEKTQYTSYIFFISTLVNIGLLFVLTPIFSIYGVAISLLASNIVLLYSTMYISDKLYPIGFPIFWSITVNLLVLVIISLAVLFELTIYVKLIITITLCVIMGIKYRKSIVLVYHKIAGDKKNIPN